MNDTTLIRRGEVQYSDCTRAYRVHQDTSTGHVTAALTSHNTTTGSSRYTRRQLRTFEFDGMTVKAPSRGLALDLWVEVH